MARSVRLDEADARAIDKVLHAAWCDSVLTFPERRAQGHLAAALARLDRVSTKARPKRKPEKRERRLAFVQVRSTLPAAPRLNR